MKNMNVKFTVTPIYFQPHFCFPALLKYEHLLNFFSLYGNTLSVVSSHIVLSFLSLFQKHLWSAYLFIGTMEYVLSILWFHGTVF